jgi:NAD(P)H dehydrogenase (quinone)
MIVVTGATGKLGHHIIQGLLQSTPAVGIVAAVRNVEKAKDLASLGVQIRQADYSKVDTLPQALAGANKLMLISSSEVGQRVPQHKAVINAAKEAGVSQIAYTSILRADTSSLALAAEHLATERFIQETGLSYIFLRNGWYLENHTEQLGSAVQHGAILGAAGEGRFASASRSDYAAAAVAAIAKEGHENKIYELAGDSSFTLTEFAAEVSRQIGKPFAYRNLAPEAYQAALESFGLPAAFANILVDSDLGAARGELDGSSNDFRSLIGRPTTTLRDAISFALKR